MVRNEDKRPVGAFSKAVSAKVKGLMAEHGVTQGRFADALGRNQGYISERANGLKAFTTDELDVFAGMIGMTGQALLSTVSRRIFEDDTAGHVAPVIDGGFGKNSVPADEEWAAFDDDGNDGADLD